MHRSIGQMFLVIFLAATAAAAQTNTFPTTGNVGIGTTSPAAYPLQVIGNVVSGSGVTGQSGSVGILPGGSGSWFWLDNPNANYLRISNGEMPGSSGVAGSVVINNAGMLGVGVVPATYKLDVAGQIHSSGGIVFPDGTTQTTALNSGGATFTTADSSFGNINITLNGASVPVINFTRWVGSGAIQDNASIGMFANPNDGYYDFGIGTGISSSGSQTTTNTIVTVTQGGNVGIGTTSPGKPLDVSGTIRTSANSTTGDAGGIVFPDGTTQTTAFIPANCGADYAEAVAVSGDRTAYEPGDLLVIDPDAPGKFLKSNQPYSTLVSGIYSTKPGFVGRLDPPSTIDVPMAMVGRVPTKVSAENGPIRVGDLLVSSSTLGYAMKGTDRTQMLGAVIGKALAPLDSGTGTIMVLVTLQ